MAGAEYVDGYRIRVRFSTPEEGVVHPADGLWGPVFEPLKDPAKFRQFEVSDVLHTIAWDNGADLAFEYLYERMVKGAPGADTASPQP